MILVWAIRYWDSKERVYKDRRLSLDTNTLEPIQKNAIEICQATSHNHREMIRFRHLFKEITIDADEDNLPIENGFAAFCVIDYFEDEHGNILTNKQRAIAHTGDPDAILIPNGFEQHDIDLLLVKDKRLELNSINISLSDLKILGYFARDYQDLANTAFTNMQGNLFSLTTNPKLKTAPTFSSSCTDDEICSHLLIFRRLYMAKEKANFVRSSELFTRIMEKHPLSIWTEKATQCYIKFLDSKPQWLPMYSAKITFTNKKLIDIYLYTQYVHQPCDINCKPTISKDYQKSLLEVDGYQSVLMSYFIYTLSRLSSYILYAGQHIVHIYKAYCQYYGCKPDIIPSPAENNPELGSVEKQTAKRIREFDERIIKLSHDLWKKNGNPNEEIYKFVSIARYQLSKELGYENYEHFLNENVS